MQVLCADCKTAIAEPQPLQLGSAASTTAIATPEDALQARVPAAGSVREGLQRDSTEPLPSIRKDFTYVVLGWLVAAFLVCIALIAVGLMIVPVSKARVYSARHQSTNNLKNIALAFHNFEDVNKQLPFNGNVPAVARDNTTGSWAFQILPYIDQEVLFNKKPLDKTVGIAVYNDPARGRPFVSTTGAWTDYFINPWINDPINGAVDAPDARRQFIAITDGTSFTIMVAQGTIDPQLYSTTAPIAQSTDIFKGGGPATARRSTTNHVDTSGDQTLTWGGPFPPGVLIAFGDGTVRMFPYSGFSGVGDTIINGRGTGNFAPFLTPTGGEVVELPDV